MTTKLTVLNQIEADLKDNLHTANGYEHTPVEIKRGIYKWDDAIVKPALYFTLTTDTPAEEQLYGEDTRWLTIFFYIYSQTDGVGNTTQIFEMLEDLETFLQNTSHFTYSNQTMLGDIEVKEGGSSDPINTALMQTQILYES